MDEVAAAPERDGGPPPGAYYSGKIMPIVLIIVGVQLLLPSHVTIGPFWLIPAIELLGAPLGQILKRLDALTSRALRLVVGVYLVFLGAVCVMNATLLLLSMLYDDDTGDSGKYLLLAGLGVLVINVLSFGLIFWWVDGGGPRKRALGLVDSWDLQFPQQTAGLDWIPTQPDYMFTAYTNIIAFSPTDTMPLTHRVKLLFTVQSAVSLVTVLVTVSRAINLLN